MTRPNACAASELTAGALVHKAARRLMGRDPDAARLEAELLLAFVLGVERSGLYCRWDERPAPGERAEFEQLIERRLGGEPLAYLTGEREFMGLAFQVTPAVLVPRPETELLVETALALLREGGPCPRVVDVGTGSGAIAVSLAVNWPTARVLAVDISEAALVVAGHNARRFAVGARISFHRGDLLSGIDGPFDLIAANLPYIPSGDLGGLPDEVGHEPRLALDGGPDGLGLYRRLVPQAAALLPPGGYLLAELSPQQEKAALGLVEPPFWQARVERDWAGRPRLLVARRRGQFDLTGPRAYNQN